MKLVTQNQRNDKLDNEREENRRKIREIIE